ncbi:MAG: TonB-dependent receptor domain-containing protein [Vulcanimicrobiaceae bacterium]
MSVSWTPRRGAVALMLLVTMLCQGTWALAGTTGGLSGTVTDDKGAPIAGAAVKAASPSETVSQTTDATGHFRFLSLAADTYTVSISKDAFNPSSYTGVTVFADQNLALSFRLTPTLHVIANTSSRSAGNLVSSRTSDVYAVSAAQQNAVSGIGGGYNLDSAYSGIYAQPGVQGQIGVYGFGQVFYIRGSSYSQVGYEFDGVPVNRAFDQYNGNSVSNIGTQQTEVYTGGSPAGGTASTLGGYLNQVIKTGTYPGTADVVGGIGTPTFYHKLDFEGGGSTPDRLFSWYVGLRGANNDYPIVNSQNGANLANDGSNQWGIAGIQQNSTVLAFSPFVGNTGPWSTCQKSGAAPAGGQTYNLQYALGAPTAIDVPVCSYYSSIAAGAVSFPQYTADRENVVNLHFGIPHHHDGGKDDVQVLYDNFGYLSRYFDSINANGGQAAANAATYYYGGPTGITQGIFGITGYPGQGGPNDNICAFNALFGFGCATSGGSSMPYIDSHIFAAGTSFGQDASTANVVPYLAPSTGLQRPPGQGVDPNQASGIWNNGTIFKLQYQKNIGSNAFVRLFGYTFYSDWLQNNANKGSAYFVGSAGYLGTGFSYASPDYELSTHSRGLQLDAEDQINPQNLIGLTGNYTTANATRWNNEFWGAPGTPTNLTNGTTCFDAATGDASSCLLGATQGTYAAPTGGWATNNACANLPSTSAACLARASFQVTLPGSYGPLNQVIPKFSSVALTDEFRPNDKLNVNVGVRYENYTYDFPSTVNSEFNFWFNTAQNSYCYDPATGQPLLQPVTATTPANRVGPLILPNTVTGQNPALCYQPGTTTAFAAPSGRTAVHPNGVDGNMLFSNDGLSSVSHPIWSPRIGATYAFTPDTVLRVSGGRYTQPTATAYEQYSNASGRGAATFDFTNFWGLGFNTPVHNNPVQTSNNYDLSLEHHFKNTDWSAKLSPFYRYTTNQLVTVSLGNNFASAINAGTQETTGVELAIQKGDPSRDGLSGQLAYTFTHAVMRYNTLANGSSTIDNLNGFIRSYNGLTSYCATHTSSSQCPSASDAFPFYCAGTNGGPNGTSTGSATAAGCTGTGITAIANPYYNLPVQSLLDPNGFYPTYANNPPYTAPDGVGDTAISPNEFTGFVNYKHQRWSATLQGALLQGQSYGSPVAVVGLDPRNCAANQSGVPGVGSAYALLPNYQSCTSSSFTTSGALAIPNPLTGRFDTLSQYREPWQLNMGMQFGYDISSQIHAQLTLANIVNACFGGSSEPWTSAYPASSNCYVAAYFPSGGAYIGAQPGAGFFYGASGKDAANGTAGYPNWMNQPYVPVQNGLPLQAYLNVSVKL